MKRNNFTRIRRILWIGVGIAVALAGCGPASMPLTTPVSTLLPIVTPTTSLTTALLATPTAAPPPRNRATATPTGQYVPTFEPTPSAFPTILIDTENTPAACPTSISSSSIIRRHDDVGWRHYWSASSQVVPVDTLFADGEWLWIATAQGLIRLNQRSLDYELFSHTGTSPDIALDHLYTLAVDDQGRLWAGGMHGLVRYADEAGWKAIYTDEPVSSFALDADGNLWYWKWVDPRWHPRAYRFQGQEPPAVGDWQPEPDDGGWKDPYLDQSAWRFLAYASWWVDSGSVEDASGSTWSWSSANYSLAISRDGQTIHTVPLRYNNRVYDVVAADQTGIWIAMKNGLFYSDGQNLKSYQFTAGEATTSRPFVYSLTFTADGSGWAATSEGLFRLSDEAQEWENVAKTDVKMPIEASDLIVPDQQSGLWMLGGKDLAHFDDRSWQRWPIPDDVFLCKQYIHTMVEYQGDLWVATTNCGLWRFDGQIWDKVMELSISSLTQDHSEKLYATQDSVFVYDGTDWRRLPDCAECGYSYPQYAATIDTVGRIWKAYGSGIWRYSSLEGWCNILPLTAPSPIASILVDTHGDLWVANYLEGVLHCDQENCELWNFGDNQQFEAPIAALAADSQGRIWVGGYGLLSVYDPAAER